MRKGWDGLCYTQVCGLECTWRIVRIRLYIMCFTYIIHVDRQKYKEKVISLEHDIRREKQIETDLYKELDGALKDLEDVSKRWLFSCIANWVTVQLSGKYGWEILQYLSNATLVSYFLLVRFKYLSEIYIPSSSLLVWWCLKLNYAICDVTDIGHCKMRIVN